MIEKRINILMLIMSLVGGIIGFIIGEVLLSAYKYTLSSIVLMGLYFGILAFCIGTMCLIGEIINPRLNGFGWKNNYLKTSFKFLIPCTLILLFVFGALFQFLYEISTDKFKKINDVVIAIDTSGSMQNTDPNNERFYAATNFLDSMDSKNRFSIYKFSDTARQIIPMVEINENTKKDASEKLKEIEIPKGNTNMGEALEKSYKEIKNSKESDRSSMVILLSDGGDTYNLDNKFYEVMKPFKDERIPVYTIGMSNGNNFNTLKEIAKESGGNYYNVKEIKDLRDVFNKIYKDREKRLIVDKRNGIYENSTLYKVLRIGFIALIAALISMSVSFVFDNKNMLKKYIISGILSGFIAGAIIEFGFLAFPWMGIMYRALADIIIALVFAMIPINVEIKDYSKQSYSRTYKNTHIENREINDNNMFR